MKRWTNDEIASLESFILSGLTHSDIANELDRSMNSIRLKASRLKIKSLHKQKKTTNEYLVEIPKNIELIDNYVNNSTPIKHKCIICSNIWSIRPKDVIRGQGCPKCYGNIKKSTEQYIKELPKTLTILEEYINNHTKILHRCSCGHEWKAKPNTILCGSGCPRCANHGFTIESPAILYIIEFTELDSLLKVGITNDYKRRAGEFGYECKPILILEFNDGRNAWDLEKEYLKILKPYMHNTGLLRSGNTETFRI